MTKRVENYRSTVPKCCATCKHLVPERLSERPLSWLSCEFSDVVGLDIHWHVNNASGSMRFVCDTWEDRHNDDGSTAQEVS